MTESAAHKPLNPARLFAVIVLSLVSGAVIAFVVDVLFFHTWPKGPQFGWVIGCLVACLVCVLGWRAVYDDKEFDLRTGSRSHLPIWKRPSVWGPSVIFAGTQFMHRIDAGSNLVSAVARALFYFVGFFACFAIVVLLFFPRERERESLD
jgi:hypothetical protein